MNHKSLNNLSNIIFWLCFLAVDNWKWAGHGVWRCDALHPSIFTNTVQTNHPGILHVCVFGLAHGKHAQNHFLVWESFWDSSADPEHPDEPHHVRSHSSLCQDQQQRIHCGEEERSTFHRLWSGLFLEMDRFSVLSWICYVHCFIW